MWFLIIKTHELLAAWKQKLVKQHCRIAIYSERKSFHIFLFCSIKKNMGMYYMQTQGTYLLKIFDIIIVTLYF